MLKTKKYSSAKKNNSLMGVFWNSNPLLLSNKARGLIIGVIIFTSSIGFGQVNLKINPSIIVKTKNGVLVRLDGDLIENESGYLEGLIRSGFRTNITNFAGLSIDSGMEGYMSRITGHSYSKGIGELPNFKRYYEINNTGGSDLITQMEIECLITGDFNETNGLIPPFHIYSFATEWIGYGDGNQESPVSALSVTIPIGMSDWIISDNQAIVTVDELKLIPDEYELFQNYPNPFNPETTIEFGLPEDSNVRLTVFNILGELVADLVNDKLSAGYHTIIFNAGNIGSGIYVYRIESTDFVEIKKMILLK